MKGINLLDEVVASLDRWAVVPNGMKTRFDIGQLHSSGLLVGSSTMGAGFIRRGKTLFEARPCGAVMNTFQRAVAGGARNQEATE
jgi:hypothetical protein